MISITCTNCQARLTIDDAFAGGVCRCQYCGTIQTVPAKSAAPTLASPKPTAPVASKTLFQNQARVRQTTTAGTGLDDIADAVVSSGLSGSGLSSGRHTVNAAGAAKDERASKHRLMLIVLIACGVIIVLLGIILIVVLTRGHGAESNSTITNQGDTTSVGPATTGGATLCGIPLHTKRIIFLLDRGNSLTNDFDTLKAATYKAIDELGPGRKFQVVLWDNDSGAAEFPAGQLGDATPAASAELRKYLQDTIATGRSHLSTSLKEAASRDPQEIVIATGKGAFELDDDDSAVLRSMSGKNIRIDAIQIQSTPSPIPVLQEVSRSTGGQFRVVTPAELREFAH